MALVRTPFGQTMPAGRASEFTPPHPERTAYRVQQGFAGDYVYNVWPTRAAMLKAIHKADSIDGGQGRIHWRECEPCPHGVRSHC